MSLRLWCITMIDPATNWFEMKQLKEKSAITIANIVEQTWLSRYPKPNIINYDHGTEFMTEFAKIFEEDYEVRSTTFDLMVNHAIAWFAVIEACIYLVRLFRMTCT